MSASKSVRIEIFFLDLRVFESNYIRSQTV